MTPAAETAYKVRPSGSRPDKLGLLRTDGRAGASRGSLSAGARAFSLSALSSFQKRSRELVSVPKKDRPESVEERGKQAKEVQDKSKIPGRQSKRLATKDPVDYWEGGSSQVEEDEAEGRNKNPLEIGMVCMTADPRCLDFHEQDDGADVVLNMQGIREVMKFMSEQARREDSIYKTPEWLSTAQMGWALGEESMEVEAPDEVSGKK